MNIYEDTNLYTFQSVGMYLRKSRAEALTDPTQVTLKKHRDLLERRAKELEIDVTDYFEEVLSGESISARPEMQRLLRAVEDNKFDAVLVMDIDRLGRGGMQDQGVILDAFKYSNTKIITPDKIFNLSDDSDEELTEFKTFMSRREYKIITKRLSRGLHKTLEDGGYIANAPYGYRKIYVNRKPTLEINEDEAYFVRMMFDMYLKGYGTTTIAETISSLGAKPHRSERFGRTSVMHILKNPTFIGKIVWDKKKHIRKGARGNTKHMVIYQPKDQWTISDGLHPPIIDDETFNKVQELIGSRYIPPSNTGETKSPLAGIVHCGNCGGIMQRAVLGENKGGDYILCTKKGCIASAKYKLVEDAVLYQLELELHKLEIDAPLVNDEDISVLENSLAEIKKETASSLSQKSRLHDLLEQGVYDVDTFKERSQLLIDKLNTLHYQEKNIEEAIIKAKKTGKKALIAKIRNVLEVYGISGIPQKNLLLKSVIRQVYYRKDKKTKPAGFHIDLQLNLL